MTMINPITPPPELVGLIIDESKTCAEMIQRAYTAGADQELEACCEWLCTVERWKTVAEGLRTSRRPKPQSLREQALSDLAAAVAVGNITPERGALIRKALEQL